MVQDTRIGKLSIEKKLPQDDNIYKGPWFGTRHVQMILLFLLVCIAYAIRVNLSVGIVAMTDTNNTSSAFPTYKWKDKSVVLSSFFWGYVLPQVGAGQMAKNFGARWVLIVAMAICSLFTVLIPVMAKLGSYGVMICRVAQGFSQGFFYPCVHNLLSKWVPHNERTRMGTFVYAGGPFGTVLAMPMTGWICDSSLGWPAVFYIFGGLGLGWTILYIILGSNSAFEHKTISHAEKDYIKKSLGLGDKDDDHEVSTPWKAIFGSLPVWAILIAHCGQNWGFWTLLTEIPIYMNKVLNYDISSNGLISALPYFVLWVLSFFFGAAADFLINRKIIALRMSRKINTFIGLVGPAVALVALGVSGSSDSAVAIALLVVAVGINSATYSGYQVNHIDLSPKHAGTLMGITNGAANVFSIIAPLAVQFVVTDESNTSQWEIVFYVASAIYVVTALFYCVYGSGDRQDWDSDTKSGKAGT